MTTPTLDVRRAAERFHTRIAWLDSHHSFSFSRHYDPSNIGHGLLLVNNDDVVRAGSGFDTHPHQDMEIVTWVLDGELEHKDSEGNRGLLYPGLAQRMSAGTGIWHSEMNPRGDADVHFVQMWVQPDTARDRSGLRAARHQRLAGEGRPRADRVRDAVTTPRSRSANAVPCCGAGASPRARPLRCPDDRYVHLFVARGEANLEGAGELATGDAVRLTAAGSPSAHRRPAGAEVLIWATA